MKLYKKRLSDFLYKLYEQEDIFLHVIDKYLQNKNNQYSIFFIENLNNFFINDEGHLYISVMQSDYINSLALYITSHNIPITYVYGETSNVLDFNTFFKKGIEISLNYYVMKLDRKAFHNLPQLLINNSLTDRFCCPDDFFKLKNLQLMYHLEEVYSDTKNYPKQYEMNAFKKILNERDNYAVFIMNDPISKVYINASSEKTIQIGGIYTLKKYRGNGFGYYCIYNFLKKTFNKYSHIESCQLFVKNTNMSAYSLYKKLGFQILSKTTSIYYKALKKKQ
ncbi:MAG: hypothetical protein A2015_05030 [Spirochaetes bacterium GWF1_31_7]|nr:MAG: hypothetical protein A2Y30_16430 [Spirochaetes bacterium GWE1_32_154]OHD48561.1 MAG: hypothetical protein A2Y29_14405 [Spirochaetes bacterium GWE2_31_10]OHD50426.1 MAG: hypothetical protein A2015_05030 [Spirochaetes bacterium GWF1_31_7]OHD78445.1 MAG: hypothetical protein A2355_09205 [Spirochaetes bacterium RIFOXYB1_FULL_32_8]HBD93303.1 hypothetical protein [Spirochaetia bacterium]